MKNDLKIFNRDIGDTEGGLMITWGIVWAIVALVMTGCFLYSEVNLAAFLSIGIAPLLPPALWLLGMFTARDQSMTAAQSNLLYAYRDAPKELRKQVPLTPEVISIMDDEEAWDRKCDLERLIRAYKENQALTRKGDQRIVDFDEKVAERMAWYEEHTKTLREFKEIR